MRVVVAAAVFSCLLPGALACFELPRSAGIGEGRIRFTVRDSAGAPVAGATVFADGTNRYAKADADGLVSVEGLVAGDYVLRVGADDDGDHRPDRAAVVTATLVRVPFDKGLFVAPQERLTSALPGDVTLTAVGNLSVGLGPCPADSLCRVVVFRDVVFADGHVVAGAVEQGGVLAGGNFQLTGVAAGAVKVAAFAWPRPLSTSPRQQSIAASDTVTAFAVADVDVVPGDTVELDLVLGAVPADVDTTVALRREAALTERATGQVELRAPDTDGLVGGGGATVDGPIVAVTVPVAVFTVDTAVASNGEFGAINVVGVPGMPVITFELANVDERACRKLGEDRDIKDCDLDGDTEDLDDDDDGQPDAEEPRGCALPGQGTDLDRDCLCDPADPFPECTSNDPVDCAVVELPDCDGP